MKNEICLEAYNKINSAEENLKNLMEENNGLHACGEISIAINYLEHAKTAIESRITRREGEGIKDDTEADTRYKDRLKTLTERNIKNVDFVNAIDQNIADQKARLDKVGPAAFEKWEASFKQSGNYSKYLTAKKEIADFEENFPG